MASSCDFKLHDFGLRGSVSGFEFGLTGQRDAIQTSKARSGSRIEFVSRPNTPRLSGKVFSRLPRHLPAHVVRLHLHSLPLGLRETLK